jgi:hypothetical protein
VCLANLLEREEFTNFRNYGIAFYIALYVDVIAAWIATDYALAFGIERGIDFAFRKVVLPQNGRVPISGQP